MSEADGRIDEIAELNERVEKLEKSAWRTNKELTELRETFAVLKERAGITGDVRPPLVFKDSKGQVVPERELPGPTEIESLELERLGSGRPIILTFPERRRLKLRAFVEAKVAEPLYISLHGAMQVGEQSPRFERVRSLRNEGLSFCAIADPTIDLADELNLGWYVGHNSFDLRPSIQQFIDELIAVLSPSQVIFVGGSGGGFAAMQLSALIPGSLAFVTDPQVIIPKYYAGHVARLLRHAFDDFTVDAAMGEFGERLSVVEAYRVQRPDNFLYYCQHRGDEFHAENHLEPLRVLLGAPAEGGESDDGRMMLRWFEGGSHGPLRGPREFESELATATAWHAQALRADGAVH